MLGLHETILSMNEPLLAAALERLAGASLTDAYLRLATATCQLEHRLTAMLCSVPRMRGICDAQGCADTGECSIGGVDPCLLFTAVRLPRRSSPSLQKGRSLTRASAGQADYRRHPRARQPAAQASGCGRLRRHQHDGRGRDSSCGAGPHSVV